MKPWLLAARPKTLPAAIVPVWAGSVLAWKLTGVWSPWLAVCAVLSTMCLQIATNFFNDALDFQKGADTARRLGPTRVTASGLLSARAVTWMGAGVLLAACALAAPLIAARGWPILAIGIPSLYFCWGYTGGPAPLAYRGLGELFVLLFFGLVAVAGTVFVHTGQWFWKESLLLGAQVGGFSTALIAINNLRDVEEDSHTGKRTLAVRFGIGWAKGEVAALCVLPWVLGAIVWGSGGLAMLALHLAGMAFSIWLLAVPVLKTPPSPAYNRFLARAGAQLVLFAVFFTAGVLAQSRL